MSHIEPGTESPGLDVTHLGFVYPNNQRFELRPTSFAIRNGSRLGIVGLNGSGKSTLLRALGGHIASSTGSCVMLAGTNVTKLQPGARGMRTVFQEDSLLPHLTAEENIALSLHLGERHSRSSRNELVRYWLKLFELTALSNRRPTELSGGERQRVELARALIVEPSVLLLDEPTLCLDSQQQNRLVELLTQASTAVSKTIMLVVTHDYGFAISLCDQLAVMDGGRIIELGDVESVLHSPRHIRTAEILETHNVLRGDVDNQGIFRMSSEVAVELPVTRRPVSGRYALLLRPDQLSLCQGSLSMKGKLLWKRLRAGPSTRLCVQLAGHQHLMVDVPNSRAKEFPVGTTTVVSFDFDNAILLADINREQAQPTHLF